MMLKTVLDNPWVRALGVLLAGLLVCLLCYLLKPVLVSLFLAFLVAYVFDPLVSALERRRISRTVSIACLGLVGLGLLVSIPVYVMPRVMEQAEELMSAPSAAPDTGTGLSGRVDDLLNRLPLERIVRELGLVDEDATDINPRALLAQEIGNFVKEHASSMMAGWLGAGAAAGSTVASLFSSIGRGTLGVLAFLGNLVLFTFVAAYLLKDFDAVVEGTKSLVPPRYRRKTFSVAKQIDRQIHGFLRGQAFVCVCLGVMYGVGLVASGVPFAVVIAAFGGVASFVPYLGLILTIGPALLLTLLQHGIDGHVVGVVATFVVAQSIEGTLLTPKIVGEQVGLGPVWVILAIMVFSTALGFLGLLLAVPIAAALKVLVVEAVGYYKGSPLFEAGGDSGSAREDGSG